MDDGGKTQNLHPETQQIWILPLFQLLHIKGCRNTADVEHRPGTAGEDKLMKPVVTWTTSAFVLLHIKKKKKDKEQMDFKSLSSKDNIKVTLKQNDNQPPAEKTSHLCLEQWLLSEKFSFTRTGLLSEQFYLQKSQRWD